MMPPAIGAPPSTRSRMVSAAVCQPLAASPPNSVAFAAVSSRWNGWGSYWAAKLFISAVSTRRLAERKICPAAKSSR